MTSINRALLLLLSTTLATPAFAEDVTPIDAWGRHVPAFDLKYKTVGKAMVYVPQGHFYFMVKGAESDDLITAQYFNGKKAMGAPLKCNVTLEDIPGTDAKLAVTHECSPDLDKHGLSSASTFSVKLGYKQTSAGKEHKDLATYTFATKAHGGAGKTKEFHVDYDFRLGEAWVHQLSDGGLHLFAWFKESGASSTDPAKGKMRCSVGPKKWEFAEMTNSRWSHTYDDYAEVKDGTPAKTRWTYQYFFPTGDVKAWLAANPGDYRCVYTRGGELERELSFAVKDGAIVKPRCQVGDKPLVVAPPSTTYVKQVVKASQDAPHDTAAYGKGALFGKPGVAAACGF